MELFRIDHKPHEIPVNVMYLIYHRGAGHSYTDAVGERIVDEYSKDAKVPMIAVTFDIPNHGEREVSEMANAACKDGNEPHALDMIICIEFSINDIKLVMDLLPIYLNLGAHLAPDLKDENVPIRFHSMLSGYPKGGHIINRFASI